MGANLIRCNPFESPLRPAPVVLNIYNVGTSGKVKIMNKVLRPLGAGAFHCGVEVFGVEWSYGDFQQGTGVFTCTPRLCKGHTYTESLDMGRSPVLEDEFLAGMREMEARWLGADYDLFKWNCCDFCDEVLALLKVARIPAWVTTLAKAGAAVAAAGDTLENNRRSFINRFANTPLCPCLIDEQNSEVRVVPHSREDQIEEDEGGDWQQDLGEAALPKSMWQGHR